MHEEIDKRAIELKNSVETCFLNTTSKIDKYNSLIENLQQKIKYYQQFLIHVWNYGNTYDFQSLSTYVLYIKSYFNNYILLHNIIYLF